MGDSRASAARRSLYRLRCLTPVVGVLCALAWASAVAQPRSVTLTFPEGYIVQQGAAVTYTEPTVDAIVRSQSMAYLEGVVASMKPKPPEGMRIGVVVGKSPDPGCEAGVYLAGWVVERATRVDLTVDGTVPVSVTPTVTMAGYPKSWKWCVPAKWQDGREHKVYIRAMNGSVLIGPLDNATALNRWPLKIPQ
jgi:hypothetical protein